MRRRGLMAGAIAAGAMMLTGCGPWSIESRVNRAAESADGVQTSELSLGIGGTFGPRMSGEVRCSVAAEELEAVFDEAWKNVVTLLHDADDGGRQVQSVTAVGQDGTAIGPRMWLSSGNRGHVSVFDFFERYGLE